MKIKGLFSDKKFNSQLIHLAAPIAFQNLMLAMVAAADAFMLGGVDQNSMSAVSLATQIQFIQNIAIYASVAACAVLGAQYMGKGDTKTTHSIFCMTLRLSGLFSILTFAGCEFCPGFLMTIFTDEEELIAIGIGYLKIAGWSYLMTGVSQCYLAVMKVTDHTSSVAIISTASVIINIALNAVFIFGLLGVPALGVKGAAYATLTARTIELVWCILLSFKKGYLRLHIAGLFRYYRVLEKDYFRCILPLLGASFLWGIGFTSYSAFMGHMGEDAAAANSVAAVVRDLVCCLCKGIASGGGIVIGNELGVGNLEKGKEYGDKILIIGVICGIVSMLLVLASIPLVLSFVNLTEEARSNLISMMIIISIYLIGCALNTITINGIFSAGGDTAFDMYSLAVAMWMFAVPLAAAGTFFLGWPVAAVYACTCLDEVGKIPWVIFHYKKYKWVKDLTRDTV